MLGLTKRDIGTIEHAAPAFANHGTNLLCSVFARVIIGPLVEAQAPELEHLWVFADDQPTTCREQRERDDREQSETGEESQYRDHHDGQPGGQVKTELFARLIERLID